MLADRDIGKQAIVNRKLLADVVRLKSIFYNTAYANYDACLNRQLRLVPDGNHRHLLGQDFAKMIEAGMFIGSPPVFEDVLERLDTLQTEINNGR